MRFAVESPVLHHLLLCEYFIFLCAGVWLCACLCTVYVTGACAEVGARSGPGATERGCEACSAGKGTRALCSNC